MNTYTALSSSNTALMPPTSDPLKLFMEDIDKTETLSGKYVKIQSYIDSLKEEKCKIKDLDLPISKQFLDHAIKTLCVEHDSVAEKIRNKLINQTGIADVDVLPEETIRVFENLSLNPTNTVIQAPQISMQSQQGSLHQGSLQQGLGQQELLPLGLGQQGSLQPEMQQHQQRLLMQQGLGQQGSLQPEMQLHQQRLLMQQRPQMMQQQEQGLLPLGLGQQGSLQTEMQPHQRRLIMQEYERRLIMQQHQRQQRLLPQQGQLLLPLGLGLQGSLQTEMYITSNMMQQQRLLQQQEQGLLQPQIIKPSQQQGLPP